MASGAPLLNNACGTPSSPALVTNGSVTTSADAKRVQVVVHTPGVVTIDGTVVGVGEYVFGDLLRGRLGYELVIVGAAADVTVIQED